MNPHPSPSYPLCTYLVKQARDDHKRSERGKERERGERERKREGGEREGGKREREGGEREGERERERCASAHQTLMSQ